MSLERVQPRVRVEIDGGGRTVLGGSCTSSAAAAFATGTVLLDPAEGRPSPGQRVDIDAGYGYSLEVIHGAEIDASGVTLAPNELEIRTTGILSRTRERIGTPPNIVAGEADQEYFLSWTGATAGTIIGDILDEYGIPHGAIGDTGKTFGNIEPVGLTAADSGWSLIEQLDEIEGYKTFDAVDGSVRRTPFAGVPSGVGRTFTQGVDLFAGRLDESRTGTYNRVIATGLPQIGTTGVDFVPTAELNAPSPWVPTPPTYRAYTYNSPLLETEDDCEEYAARKLGELNRLRGELPFDLAMGDATLRVGMSVAIDSLILDVRANVRFWVLEVTHDFSNGFNTSGKLLMTSQGTGWSANQAPIAIIDASAKAETLADATEIVAVSLDGSASYDPELGKAGIVSYIWTGSPVTPTVRPGSAGMMASAVYAGGIPTGASITLTVTDNLGKTGASTIFPADGGLALKQRDLISAELTRLQTTRDGGATWNSVLVSGSPIAAIGTCEFAAALYTFAWDAAGHLYKVLADDTATLVLSGAGITACGITLTNGDPETPTGRVWAAGTGGATYRSRADGETGTWESTAALPNGATATYILESPFAEGDVEAAAGNVYYRTFDNGGSWIAQYTHPHTSLIAKRVASGFGKGWVGYGDGGGDDLGASRLVERDDSVTLDWLPGDKPVSVAGLAVDPFEDVIYALDTDDGGLGRAWVGDGGVGGNMAAAGAWDTVAWGVPRHMIRDGTAPGYLYIAATDNLLKSVDGLQTILELKNLSGGAQGRMLGYGAERVAAQPLTVISTPGQEKGLFLWNGSGNDAAPSGWYAVEYDDTAWGPSLAGHGSTGTVGGGAASVETNEYTTIGEGVEALIRRSFVAPRGTISAATLEIYVDNYALEIYLNGILVGGDNADRVTKTIDVTAAILPGRRNVLGIHLGEKLGGVTGSNVSTAFRLRVNV